MEDLAAISAATLTHDRVTAAFNRAFTGYFLPMSQTPESLARIMRETDVSLASSVALTVAGEMAGIGLVAVRGERAWVAGMGIDPRFRRRGYGRRLLRGLVSGLREARIDVVLLEVLSINVPAISLYLSVGFRDTRELRVIQGPLRFNPPLLKDDPTERVAPVARRMVMADFDSFHQTPPAWQREARSIARIARRLEGVGIWRGAELRTYLLFTRQAEGVVIFDAGSRGADHTACVAAQARLLRYVASGHEDIPFRAINVPVGDAMGDALLTLGAGVVMTQREMELDLSESSDSGGDRFELTQERA